MACFLAPVVEAVAVTVIEKIAERNEKAPREVKLVSDGGTVEKAEKPRFSRKLKWLRNMLWGGSALLAFEHVWHGEVVPWFPFLTAAADPADASEMLHEIATVGVAMAALVTLAWLGMLGVSKLIEKRALKAAKADA